VQRVPEPEALPIFVFDPGYDPVKLQRALEGRPARILVKLHSNRVFYAEPETSSPRPVGRPRRHGKRFDLKDPARWPEPTREHRCETDDYGSVRLRCWSGLHPQDPADSRALRLRKGARGAGLRGLGRGGQVAQADPQTQEALVVVERSGRGGPGLIWRAYSRRFDLEHAIAS
jgi:hypothetical protein